MSFTAKTPIVGRRYGMLVITERVSRLYWRAHCDCGVDRIVNAVSIRDGKTKSCGCFRRAKGKDAPLPDNIPGCQWIPLGHGLFALIDLVDWEIIKNKQWHLQSMGYPSTTIDKREVLMHTLIIPNVQLDHINMNKLDNRRENLRPATSIQNNQNKVYSKNTTTGFVGVRKLGRKWEARVSGKYIGLYNTPQEAAQGRDAFIRSSFGEFGTYNFPLPGERSCFKVEQ